jgi:hypothetical protein
LFRFVAHQCSGNHSGDIHQEGRRSHFNPLHSKSALQIHHLQCRGESVTADFHIVASVHPPMRYSRSLHHGMSRMSVGRVPGAKEPAKPALAGRNVEAREVIIASRSVSVSVDNMPSFFLAIFCRCEADRFNF